MNIPIDIVKAIPHRACAKDAKSDFLCGIALKFENYPNIKRGGHTYMELKTISELKKSALERMKNCWCECIAVFMVKIAAATALVLAFLLIVQFLYTYGYIEYGIDTIFQEGGAAFYGVLILLVMLFFVAMVPLKYGQAWYLVQALGRKNVPVSCFFSCYVHKEHFKKVMKLEVEIQIRQAIAGIPLFLVAAGEIFLVKSSIISVETPVIYTIVWACLILLLTCVCFLYIVYSIRFFPARYIYARNPKKGNKAIIKESIDMVSERYAYFMELFVSFSGWILFCAAVFPMFFVVPYIEMTFAAATEDPITIYREEQKNIAMFSETPPEYEREENAGV